MWTWRTNSNTAVAASSRCCEINHDRFMGGGSCYVRLISSEEVSDFVVRPLDFDASSSLIYSFATYTDGYYVDRVLDELPGSIAVQMSLHKLAPLLTMKDLTAVAKLHSTTISKRDSKDLTILKLSHHHCPICESHFSIFVPDKTKLQKAVERSRAAREVTKSKEMEHTKAAPVCHSSVFPPPLPSKCLIHDIIEGYCKDMELDSFQEAGCCFCGQLTLMRNLKNIEDAVKLEVLRVPDATWKEQVIATDPVSDLAGPITTDGCDKVCPACCVHLDKGCIPPRSLTNFFWIGDVPPVLKGLTFAEQVFIAHVRHNHCLVRVSSGRAKMIANWIMFATPAARVYDVLPPSWDDLSEVLACVFIGSSPPTEADYEQMPMLVRRNKVKDALQWLKLNHSDYADLNISYENLESYPLSGIPVIVDFRKSDSDGNKIQTVMSKFDNDLEEGTTEGPCPFTVHGLTGDEYENMSIDALKVPALRHLEKGGHSLAVGHNSSPQSLYHNPQLYPQMFPWLFPYGKGGIRQQVHASKISEAEHKKMLLMYYDKHFQTDYYFPMIAFNQEQIKKGTTGSFLLAK